MSRTEIEAFLRESPRAEAMALGGLLEEELPEEEHLVVVECGDDHERSLLRYNDAVDELRFYFLEQAGLSRVHIAAPRGARVNLIRQLASPNGMPGRWVLQPRRITAAHKTIPHERVECDLELMDGAAQDRIVSLFLKWVPTT